MSIKFVPQLTPISPPAGAAAGKTEQPAESSSFAETLAEALAHNPAKAGGTEAEQQTATLLRLEMMRQALFMDGPEEGMAGANLPLEVLRALQRYTPGSAPPPAEEPLPVASAPSDPSANGRTSPLNSIVDQAANRFHLAPELLHAVIRAESDYDPRAVSSAGAQGLMQLMPATAKDLGVKDAFDPEQNVMGGARYLRQLLDRYHGNLDSALAAYNWGPGNVDRGRQPLPRETRQYVARIKNFLAESA